MERVIQKLPDLHHVYRWRRLVTLKEVDLVEVVDIAVLGVVSEKMVQGVPTDWIRTDQPKRIGPRHVLRQGGEWSVLNGTPFRSCRDHQIFILPPWTACMSGALGVSGMVILECRRFVACSRSI